MTTPDVEPTNKAERERRLITLNERMPTERFCLRLIHQVEALEAESERLRGFVQSISAGDLQYFQDSAESTIAWIQTRALKALEQHHD